MRNIKEWWRWFSTETGSWWMATIFLGVMLSISGACVWAAKVALSGTPVHDAIENPHKRSASMPARR